MNSPKPRSPEPPRSKTLTHTAILWKRYWNLPRLDKILTTALLLAFVGFIVSRIIFVVTTGGYIMPKDSDDWAAWGTWVGGLATAAAFLYTALQLRDQRAVRAKEEARRLAELAESAKLIGVEVGGETLIEVFAGIPAYDQFEAEVFDGSLHTLVINNYSDEPISTVVIELNRAWSLPPVDGVPRPNLKTGGGQGTEAPTNLSVSSSWGNFKSLPNPSGKGRMIECEHVLPGTPQKLGLTFVSSTQSPKVTSFKFTDAAGFRWKRNTDTGELRNIPI